MITKEQTVLDSIVINKTAKELIKNHFDVIILDNKKDVIKKLIEIIDNKAVIGYGGSYSLEQLGFFDIFTVQNYPNLLDRKNPNITPELKFSYQQKALTADYFIASANAISQNGEIILIDKWGNRNAAMTFGPKKRIFIIGKNKIVNNMNNAVYRAQNTAAVLNNIRFNTKNPCTVTGQCMDCDSPDRLCSITTIIHKCHPPQSILIILINEDLGF